MKKLTHPERETLHLLNSRKQKKREAGKKRLRPGQAGGLARAKQFTSEYQRAAQAARSHESLSAAGKLGFRAAFKTHPEKALAALHDWRSGRGASSHHLWMRAYLRDHTPVVWNEIVFPFWGETFEVDFALPDPKIAIEVNGHQNTPAWGESEPRVVRQQTKIERMQEEGWRVHVFDAQTKDRAGEVVKLDAFLNEHHMLVQ